MAKRPKSWCPPERHSWQRAAPVMVHLPLADGTTPELLIRVCTQCPLAEVMHVRHRGGEGKLVAYEHWWLEEDASLKGWQHTEVIWDKGQEAQSWL